MMMLTYQFVCRITRRRRIAALAALWAAVAGVTPAECRTLQMTGNNLQRFCLAKGDEGLGATPNILCLGYITAILELLDSGSVVGGRRACIPQDADANQLNDIVTNYIRSHPETRHLAAHYLVALAFSLAFPCR